ncbi:MAG: exosortase U [Gemmataceae bacterium]
MSMLCETDAIGGAPPERRQPTAPAVFSGKLLTLSACALVACAPLAIAHFRQIAQRPHYQFFPLALLAACMVALIRFRPFHATQVGAVVDTAAALGAGLLGLAVAIVIDSSWLGYLALLVTVVGLVYGATGREGLRHAVPALALLIIVLPPPFEMDREWILALRRLTTQWSGLILDAMKVPHLMAGNVVELGHRRLMVEDACSGINSLFALVATALFFAALFGRSLVHTFLLVVAAIWWVLVANVARVVAVVLADRRGLDWTEGWRHEALSIALFVVATLLTGSTDCLFRLIFVQFAAWRARGRADDEAVNEVEVTPKPTISRPRDFAWSWMGTTMCSLAFLGLAGAYWGLNGSSAIGQMTVTIARHMDRFGAELLPDRVGDWQRTEFRPETRNPGSAFGEFSRVWTYRHGIAAATISADYPFPGWHDLTRCYTSQGWVIHDQNLVAASSDQPGFVEVEFERAGFQSAYLLYAEVGPTGEPLEPRLAGAHLSLHRQRSTMARLAHRFGLAPAPPPEEPQAEVGQIQLFIHSEIPLSAEQKSAAQALFRRAYSAIQKTMRNPV